jgi:DNA polymerase III delta subunit
VVKEQSTEPFFGSKPVLWTSGNDILIVNISAQKPNNRKQRKLFEEMAIPSF